MKKLVIIASILLIGMFSLYSFYTQSKIAFNSHITAPMYDDSIDGVFTAFGEEITSQVPKDKPLVILVPLNGYPDTATHPTYINSRVVQEVLKGVTVSRKYLILSEGYTGTQCISGAEATAALIGLKEGYNEKENLTVLLENHATTTLENIQNSKKILEKEFPKEDVYVIIAGMTDVYPFADTDIGHGARAFMFAKQNFASLPNVHIIGLLPTNMIDIAFKSYPHEYNAATMYLGANGLLNLPVFDKKYEKKQIPGCIESQ
jgi:uncharacterized SAM-binding protein YcdF (DUF218 family)